MSDYVKWGALSNVIIGGLIVGAGLPALFALGVRSLAGPGARDASGHKSFTRVAIGYLCFAVVIGSVAAAIIYIAKGGH